MASKQQLTVDDLKDIGKGDLHQVVPSWKLAFAAVWIIGFLWVFFLQPLPNNSTAEDPLDRLSIWSVIVSDPFSLLNPLDYSWSSQQASWSNMGQRVPHAMTALMIWLSALGMGRFARTLLLRGLRLRRSECLVIDGGIGLSLLSLLVLLCGIMGQFNQALLLMPGYVLGVASLTFSFWQAKAGRQVRLGESQSPNTQTVSGKKLHKSFGVIDWLLCTGIVAFGLHMFLGTFTPAYDFDVREYHLHGPRQWWQAGQIQLLSHNVYTSFPFLSEMLSLLAMVIDDDPWSGAISGKATLGAFSFLSVVAVYAIAARNFGRQAGLLAALIAISTPWLTRISIIAYAESAITFYLIATVLSALRLLDSNFRSGRLPLIAVIGFLAGSAMASKYPGIVSVVIPVGGFLLWSLWRTVHAKDSHAKSSQKTDVALAVGIYSLGVFLAVGPWLARNVHDTGNPIYPLVWSVFGGTDWDESLDQKWKAAHSASEHNFAAIPIHLKDVALRNDWQNGLLFALAIPGVLMLWRRPDIRWLAGHAAWLLGSWWLLTHRIDRFWVPIIPVMAVLASGVWVASESRIWRYFVVVMVGISCVFHYGLCRTNYVGFHVGLTELNAASEQVVRADFRYLNAALPDDSRVLMVGEAEVFDCRFDTIYNTVFDESIFQSWTCAEDDVLAGTSRSGDLPMKPMKEIHTQLISAGVTHVYVNWLEILRYRLTYGYTSYVNPERFHVLIDRGVLLPGNATASGEWASLSDQQQKEIRSWNGNEFLMQAVNTWGTQWIYRVNPNFAE